MLLRQMKFIKQLQVSFMRFKLIGLMIICLITFTNISCSPESTGHDDFQRKKVSKRAENEVFSSNPELLYGSFAFHPVNKVAYREYLDGKRIWFGKSFEPWPIPANPTWRENPFSDRTWLLHYHSLKWLYSPAHAYLMAGNDHFLDEIIHYIFSWIDSNPLKKPAAKKMAWHDHATVDRTHLFVYFYHKFLKEKLTEEQTAVFIKTLSIHGDFLEKLLSDPEYRGHNHNLMHSRALYDLAVAFPEIPKSSEWKILSRERINQLLNEMVEISEGVSKEQAVNYHFFDLNLFYNIHKYLIGLNDGFSDEQIEVLKKMVEFAALVMFPNGNLPAIGDTQFGASGKTKKSFLANLVVQGLGTKTAEFILTDGQRGFRPADAYFYPKSGYALFRPAYSSSNEWSYDLSLVFDCGPSMGPHGHKDALSFVLYGYGSSLVIDSGGPYNYNNDDNSRRIRRGFASSKSHNIVTVDSQDYGDGDTRLIRNQDTKVYAFIEAENSKYRNVTYKRAIMFLKPDLVIVIDYLTSNDRTEHQYDLFFHFPPNSQIDLNGDNLNMSTENGSGLRMRVKSMHTISSSIIKGQVEPYFQGWATTAHSKKIPAPALQIRQEGEHCWYVTLMKPYHGKSSISMDADAAINEEKGWEITLGADLGYHKIHIPATGYPKVLDR
jgi:hypothetical protein